MKTINIRQDSKSYAFLGLALFSLDRIVITLLYVFRARLLLLQEPYLVPLLGVLFNWVAPFIIVYRVEKRGIRSLGLQIRRERLFPYSLLVFLGFFLPALFVKVDLGLFMEFAEQLAYIGLAEEFFFRGYLMTRFCDWLGEFRGLMLNAVIFGLTHIVSLIGRYGFDYFVGSLTTGFQTFMGGLLLGYIYLKSGDIVPSSIVHISLNAYLSRLT